jgi:protein-disulfide isomerase
MNRPDWMTVAMSGVTAAAISLTVMFASPALRNRAATGDVRAYLLDHPDVIPEVLQKLQDRETGKVIAANRDHIVTPVGSAWEGNPRGDVTVVEYFDYNCGYCRASLPTVAQLVASDPKVRVVYREMPVLSDQSGVAAKMSIAAAKAGRFKPFHDALYNAGPITDQSLAAAARAAGLDPAQLKAASNAPDIANAIADNLAMVRPLGMSGTPSWVIGNRVLVGMQTLDSLKDAVAAARAG